MKKILHVLNSDYGSRATMGVRSYYITKDVERSLIYCRANLSDRKKNVFTPFFGFRLLGRGIQFLRFLHPTFAKLKKIEKKIFELRCKALIKKSDIIHFFYHSQKLLDFANKNKKITIVEGFTNPEYIKDMEANGVQLDTNGFKIDSEEMHCYKNCDILLSPSDWVSHTFKNTSIKGKIEKVLYGVDSYRTISYSNIGKVKFCFAGGLKRTKGVIDLLHAVKNLNATNKEAFEIHLYGRMYYELSREIKELSASNIFIHGYVDNVETLFSDKHVYVFPTLFEGSSKTVLEAMSYGLPVITTFNSGSPVEQGINGVIVEVGDVLAIQNAMQKFIHDKKLIETYGKKSKSIADELSWSKYTKNVNDLYEKL